MILFSQLKHTSIYYQMVTNGYALSSNDIKTLFSLGLRDYQITLDGDKSVHNKRRSPNFNSFDKIIENIKYIAEYGGKINILHVIDMENIDNTSNFLDYFDSICENTTGLKEAVVFNFALTVPNFHLKDRCKRYVSGYESILIGDTIKALVKAKGLRLCNLLDICHCFRQAHNTMLITPDMFVYKCYSVFGNKNYAIGDIRNSSIEELIEKGKVYSEKDGISSICHACDELPLCRDGCQYEASHTNNGNYRKPHCEGKQQRQFIDGIIMNRLYTAY